MWLNAAWTDWLEAERSRLPLWLPVFMGAGVLAYYALRFEPAVWLGPAAALLAAAAAIRLPRLRWLLAPLAAAALGFAAAQIATARAPPIEADLPYHADCRDRHGACRGDPAGGQADHHPAGVPGRCGAAVAAVGPGPAALDR